MVTLRATDVGGAWSEAAVDIYTHDLVIVLTWETDPEAPCQSFQKRHAGDVFPRASHPMLWAK